MSTIIVIAALVELAGVLVGLATLVGSAAGSVLAAGLVGLRGQLDGDGYGAVIEVTVGGDPPGGGRPRMSRPLVVILGGTRSGKSRLGRDRATALAAGGPVTYVATALPGDRELDERIASASPRPAGGLGDGRAGPGARGGRCGPSSPRRRSCSTG